MKIQNNKNHEIAFKGYDARRLRGIVMNSNYAGIAESLRKIGEVENFKVFLFEAQKNRCIVKTDKFGGNSNWDDIWAQDYWGIVKNSLIFAESGQITEKFKKLFRLGNNKYQELLKDYYEVEPTKSYLSYLISLPQRIFAGKNVVDFMKDGKVKTVDKSMIDRMIIKVRDKYEEKKSSAHIPGGNYFVTKGIDGQDEVLVGANEFDKFEPEELCKIFETEKIHLVPQGDYHIDLHIRPLMEKKVLVADDNMTLAVLRKELDVLKSYSRSSLRMSMGIYNSVCSKMRKAIARFEKDVENTMYAKTDEVVSALEQSGYTPIRVPGRFFELEKSRFLDDIYEPGQRNLYNYLNAFVHVNDKGELVYITNKSTFEHNLGLTDVVLEKLGVCLRDAFVEAVSPYAKKIYFVSGRNNAVGNVMLPKSYGGVHCMGVEIPEKV